MTLTQTVLSGVLLSALRYACGWVRLTDKQIKTKKTLELMGSLTYCEDTKKTWDERSSEPTIFDIYSQ